MKTLITFLLAPSLVMAINIRVQLKNATTNGLGRVDELRLIQLKQGMQILKTVKDP